MDDNQSVILDTSGMDAKVVRKISYSTPSPARSDTDSMTVSNSSFHSRAVGTSSPVREVRHTSSDD